MNRRLRNRPQNHRRLFDLLFVPKTSGDKLLFNIGRFTGAAFLFAPAILGWLAEESLIYKSVLALTVICILLFFTAFTLLTIRKIGREGGKFSWPAQTLYFSRKLFLFVFFPAIVFTFLILLWAYITNQPIFQ